MGVIGRFSNRRSESFQCQARRLGQIRLVRKAAPKLDQVLC